MARRPLSGAGRGPCVEPSHPPRGEQLWLLPSEGQVRDEWVAEVAVQRRTFRLIPCSAPAELAGRLVPGAIVRCAAGRTGRTADGICVSVSRGPWRNTQASILEVLPFEPLLTPALIELGLWLADYYACPPGRALAAMVPAALRRPRMQTVACVQRIGPVEPGRLTVRQRRLLEALSAGPRRRDELLRKTGASAATLRTLVKRGLIEVFKQALPATQEDTEPPAPHSQDAAGVPPLAAGTTNPAAVALAVSTTAPPAPEDAFALTPDQQAALSALAPRLERPEFAVFLLFGVPGSGKTEVYVRAIREVIAHGRQAILLVPEIALATQVVERLAQRFPRVAVLHSRLSPRVRLDALRTIAAGRADVVIGTRTAVFAPCPRLGLIVVDEEQESSFKSLAAPLYHARDTAIRRGQIEGVPVVLGSATPSLETWYNGTALGHYRVLRLESRATGAGLPKVRVRRWPDADSPGLGRVLSPELHEQLEQVLRQGGQAILLHNRRGYSAHLRCTRCGLSVRCERCGSLLVHHRQEGAMKCHRCGLRGPVPPACLDDTCRGSLVRAGLAIQRLEEELKRAWPQAGLLRLDRDTMKRREDYEAALRRFAAHEADILLGTQMVAKGLDFPDVRLVGVIDADATLDWPDFRAAEHVFQRLVQVVGRAGRREGESLALIQCRQPQAPVIRDAVAMNYEAFAARELEVRQALGYPPFGRLVRLILADARPGRARGEAAVLSERLAELAGRVSASLRVRRAEACVLSRLRGAQRYEVLIVAPRDGSAQRLLREAAAARLLSPRVQRFTIDVDPLEML